MSQALWEGLEGYKPKSIALDRLMVPYMGAQHGSFLNHTHQL